MTTVDQILELFAVAGKSAYYGEAVSQTEHALQTAHLAEVAGADAEWIVTALLHDVGHLLSGLPENATQTGINDTHEEAGADWLSRHFRAAVVSPVKLHVAAKRYLCAVEPMYLAELSPASRLSLRLQGGPFDADAARRFEQEPHFAAAVSLRRWDDAAKVPGLAVPDLDHYRASLEAALKRGLQGHDQGGAMKPDYDVAIAGAGILGLAHAYHLARRGLRVVVFERQPRAQGASVRNFGMIWPIGQPPGPLYRLARRSVEIWLDVLRAAGLWHEVAGSLHLAYHDDEAAVLREFVDRYGSECSCSLLSAGQIGERFPAVVPTHLRCGMWSPVEVTVDSREVIAALPAWLHRTLGVDFVFDAAVLGYDRPRVVAGGRDWRADRLLVCTGTDFRELAADAFTAAGLLACKLQMMRSEPYTDGLRVGTMLAAGLTLRHYRAFAACPSLPALVQRFDREMPEHGRLGIHVLLSQNGRGEFVIGDSHEYGDAIEPFDKPRIDELVLDNLRTFANIPDLRIAARWHGVYVKHPVEPYVVADPRPGMRVVTGVGGAGMTLSFGLAEQVVASWLGEKS